MRPPEVVAVPALTRHLVLVLPTLPEPRQEAVQERAAVPVRAVAPREAVEAPLREEARATPDRV